MKVLNKITAATLKAVTKMVLLPATISDHKEIRLNHPRLTFKCLSFHIVLINTIID